MWKSGLEFKGCERGQLPWYPALGLGVAVVGALTGLYGSLECRAPRKRRWRFMLVLILGAHLAYAVCHHPEKGLKKKNKNCRSSMGLPVAVFCPQECKSRGGCRRGSSKAFY